jgi:hypothetical protein
MRKSKKFLFIADSIRVFKYKGQEIQQRKIIFIHKRKTKQIKRNNHKFDNADNSGKNI